MGREPLLTNSTFHHKGFTNYIIMTTGQWQRYDQQYVPLCLGYNQISGSSPVRADKKSHARFQLLLPHN